MRSLSVALVFALVFAAGAASAQIVVPAVETPWPGKIIVSADEWPLSDHGFETGDAEQLALNIARFFTGGRPGRFLVYSSNFGVTGRRLAETMTSAGHSWTVDQSVDFSLATLQEYDAVFLAGDPADNDVLIDYVRAGGGVFVAGGTAASGIDKATEAAQWNTLLNAFGLRLEPYGYPRSELVQVPADWNSPIFQGVGSFFYWTGNGLSVMDTGSPETRLFVASDGIPMFAVYSASVVTVDVQICHGHLQGNGVFTAAIVGGDDLDVEKIDPASIRILGVGARHAYLAPGWAHPKRKHLGKTTVDACGYGKSKVTQTLYLTFETAPVRRALVDTIGRRVQRGELIALTVTGRLKPQFGRSHVVGEELMIGGVGDPRQWTPAGQ